MLKMLWENYRSQILAGLGASLFLLVGLVVAFLPSETPQEAPPPAGRQTEARPQPVPVPVTTPPAPQAPRPPAAPTTLTVHITGQVRRPGVYSLPSGSRVHRLVEAAGGFTPVADDRAVNLAALLEDGTQIHIPFEGERLRKAASAGRGTAASGRRTSRPTKGPRVDINRASEEELTALRGIGPALARRIVEHRQHHGPFRSVEDLIQVRGIGTSKLKGLRDQAFVAP